MPIIKKPCTYSADLKKPCYYKQTIMEDNNNNKPRNSKKKLMQDIFYNNKVILKFSLTPSDNKDDFVKVNGPVFIRRSLIKPKEGKKSIQLKLKRDSISPPQKLLQVSPEITVHEPEKKIRVSPEIIVHEPETVKQKPSIEKLQLKPVSKAEVKPKSILSVETDGNLSKSESTQEIKSFDQSNGTDGSEFEKKHSSETSVVIIKKILPIALATTSAEDESASIASSKLSAKLPKPSPRSETRSKPETYSKQLEEDLRLYEDTFKSVDGLGLKKYHYLMIDATTSTTMLAYLLQAEQSPKRVSMSSKPEEIFEKAEIAEPISPPSPPGERLSTIPITPTFGALSSDYQNYIQRQRNLEEASYLTIDSLPLGGTGPTRRISWNEDQIVQSGAISRPPQLGRLMEEELPEKLARGGSDESVLMVRPKKELSQKYVNIQTPEPEPPFQHPLLMENLRHFQETQEEADLKRAKIARSYLAQKSSNISQNEEEIHATTFNVDLKEKKKPTKPPPEEEEEEVLLDENLMKKLDRIIVPVKTSSQEANLNVVKRKLQEFRARDSMMLHAGDSHPLITGDLETVGDPDHKKNGGKQKERKNSKKH